MHTWCSYDVLPLSEMNPLVLYEKARQKRFRFVTFTDHDTMDAYNQVGWTREGIVPCVEIKILDPGRMGHTLHINIYELNKKQFLELEKIAKRDHNLETFIDYLRDNNLLYVYNQYFCITKGNQLPPLPIFMLFPFFNSFIVICIFPNLIEKINSYPLFSCKLLKLSLIYGI